MKVFIAALSIFATLIIILMLCNFLLCSTFSSYNEILDSIEHAVYTDNFPEAERISVEFSDKLFEDSRLLYCLTDRTPIDNALTECSRMISFIRVKDKAESSAALSGIKTILTKTKEKSTLPFSFFK